MENFANDFVASQDKQIENIQYILSEAKRFNLDNIPSLMESKSQYTLEIDCHKEKLEEMCSGVEVAFAKIHQYENILTNLENILNQAEIDVSAIEEYAWGPQTTYFSGIYNTLKWIAPSFTK